MNFEAVVGFNLLYNYRGRFGGRGVGGLEGAFERAGFPGAHFSNVSKLFE